MFLKSVIAAAVVLSAQVASALDLNDIELGSPITIARLHDKLGIAVIPGVFATRGMYRGELRLGRCPTSLDIYIDVDGNVSEIRVHFPGTCFDQLASDALLKWGKPTSTGNYTLTNGFGRATPVREYDWKTSDDGLVMLTDYDAVYAIMVPANAGLGIGGLHLKSPAAVASDRAIEAAKKSGHL